MRAEYLLSAAITRKNRVEFDADWGSLMSFLDVCRRGFVIQLFATCSAGCRLLPATAGFLSWGQASMTFLGLAKTGSLSLYTS